MYMAAPFLHHRIAWDRSLTDKYIPFTGILSSSHLVFFCFDIVGEGSLKSRDNARMLGTDKEHILLNAEDP